MRNFFPVRASFMHVVIPLAFGSWTFCYELDQILLSLESFAYNKARTCYNLEQMDGVARKKSTRYLIALLRGIN